MKSKFENLDALRGFAALYVVLHHAVPHDLRIGDVNVGIFFRFGQEAVILFFLLSGFVINYSYQGSEDKTFKTYFIKRACRIYVPLLCVMLLGWVIACEAVGGFADVRWQDLILNLLMLQDVSSLKPGVLVEPYMGNTPLWSLSYEWWFYMLYFPLQKMNASLRARDTFVYTVATIFTIVYLFSPTFVPRLFMYLSIWWTGVVISDLVRQRQTVTYENLKRPLAFLGGIALLNGISVIHAWQTGYFRSIGVHPALELRHHLFAFLAVCLAVAWKSAGWVGFKFTLGPFLKVAPISYAIYISHHYFVTGADYLAFLDHRLIEILLYAVPMVLFCIAVEQFLYPWIQKALLRDTPYAISVSASRS